MKTTTPRLTLAILFALLLATPSFAQQTADHFIALGNKQYEEKDFDGAIRSYSECIRLSPNSGSCYLNRGFAYGAKQNYDLQIADFTQVIKLKPEFARGYYHRGIAHSNKRSADLALADFAQALKLNPQDAPTYVMRAKVYIDIENYDLAAADYDAASKISPDNSILMTAVKSGRELIAAAKNVETVKNNILKKQLTTAAELFKTGNEQLGQKNYEAAIVSFTKCIDAFPTTVECYNNRAILNAMKENYDAVISDYTTVLLFKRDADVYYRRGLAYRDKNDLDAAVKDFTQALMLNRGENPDYFMDRGATYIYKKDAFSAVSDLTQAIKLNQQESRYYFLRGYAHQGGGNKEAAIADYKQALELNPKLEPAKKMLQELGVQP